MLWLVSSAPHLELEATSATDYTRCRLLVDIYSCTFLVWDLRVWDLRVWDVLGTIIIVITQSH